jgi:hypothetical protein
MRVGRPRNKHREFRPTDLRYNLQFKGGRTYLITLTSTSAPEHTFSKKVRASSIRNLFVHVAYAIGELRAPKVARHFVISCEAVPEKEEMIEGVVQVGSAAPVTVDTPPVVLDSFDGDLKI